MCYEHVVTRHDMRCLRRLIPYLEITQDSASLLSALQELPDLVAAEPDFESLETMKLPDTLLKLFPKLSFDGNNCEIASAAFRLVSVLATLGVIKSEPETMKTIIKGLLSSLIFPEVKTSLKIAACQAIGSFATEQRFLSFLTSSNLPSALINHLSASDDELRQVSATSLLPLVSNGSKVKLEDSEKILTSLLTASQGVLATDPTKAAKSKEAMQALLGILAIITDERGHQEAVYVSEGVQMLLQIAQIDQSMSILAPVMEILTNVAKIPETMVAMLHHGGLTTLLDLLGSISPASSQPASSSAQKLLQKQKKRLNKQMLSLLLKLIHLSDNNFEDREKVVSAIIQTSNLEKLSALLPAERIGHVQQVVIELLTLAVINEESRTAAEKSNVVSNLVSLISLSMAYTSGRQDSKAERSLNRLPKTIGLLTNLSKGHISISNYIVECGVLALLLDTLNPTTTASLTIEISKLMASVSCFPISHSFLTSFLSKISKMLSNQSLEIVENAVAVLANMTSSIEARAAIFNSNTVDAVVPLMSTPRIQLQAAKFLSGISQDPRASSDMFTSVLKPLLVQLNSQVMHVKQAALKTLLDLMRSSQQNQNQQQNQQQQNSALSTTNQDSSQKMKTLLASSEGAIPSILHIMISMKNSSNADDIQIVKAAIELLSIISTCPVGRSGIYQTPNAVAHIINNLFSTDSDMLNWTVVTLTSLLKIPESNVPELVRTSGAILLLLRLFEDPSTELSIHHSVTTSIALLFQYPACRTVLIENGIIQKLFLSISEATKSSLAEQKPLLPHIRTRVFASVAALQQFVQTAQETAQMLSKDASTLKNLADFLIMLTPRAGVSTPTSDIELSDQVIYLTLLLCNRNPDTWAALVRAGGLALLLALASARNPTSQLSSLTELAKLSLDISYRKIIFEGEGLQTALFLLQRFSDFSFLSTLPDNLEAYTQTKNQSQSNANINPYDIMNAQILEKTLEVITNLCEDAACLSVLLSQDGVSKIINSIKNFVSSTSNPLQSKLIVSIAFNLVRILLQILNFCKTSDSKLMASIAPAIQPLLSLIRLDISQASYQTLQLTKIVGDTLLRIMQDETCLSICQQLDASQVFLNLLVRYRPSLQSANIAEIAIEALDKLLSKNTLNSYSNLQVDSVDLDSLFSYLNHPIILQVIFYMVSDKHSSFKSMLDKKNLSILLPHLHKLLNPKTSTNTSLSSSSSSIHVDSIDPITFVTALFTSKTSNQVSFSLLDNSSIVGLVHSLISHLDPKSVSMASNTAESKHLLSGLKLLANLSKFPVVHRPQSQSSSTIIKMNNDINQNETFESGLMNLRASSLFKASSSVFVQTDPPRLALLHLVFSIASIYLKDLELNLEEVSPLNTTENSNDFFTAISTSTTSTSTTNQLFNVNQINEKESQPMNENRVFSLAPLELMQLSESLLSILSSLSRSETLHPLLYQSGILSLVSKSLKDFLFIETENSSNTSDLSIAVKHDILSLQMISSLEILDNISSAKFMNEFCSIHKNTKTLFEILALGVSNQVVSGILEVLRVITTQKESIEQILEVDGMMPLIGLLSNDNNHITSLSLSILCNLAKFDDIQPLLSTYIDAALISELSHRMKDSELSTNVQKLKAFLGFIE